MDQQPTPPLAPTSRFWHRPTTRRALLAGGATVAAAGTAAAIVGMSRQAGSPSGGGGDDSGEHATTPGPAANAATLDRPLEDALQRAAHLLRRAGFGGTTTEIEEFAKLAREEAADRLLNFASVDNSALNARIATANFDLTGYGGGMLGDMQRWWLTRMAYTSRPLEERMTLIWHGLLTSQVTKIGGQRAKLMVRQNELFRASALPRYDDLLKAIGKDPAMMVYLDTVESSKEHPNENYARELMELFSMGVGNYSEDDVRESSRAFTGWRLTPPPRPMNTAGLTEKELKELREKLLAGYEPQFLLAARQHDSGVKTFLGRSGNFDGDNIVDIIMEQPATGRYMGRRLFTEFAHYDPSPETVDRLARVWDESGHQVGEVVRAILVSDEFYSQRSYRGLVRSPVEFVVGAVRGLGLETDFRMAGVGPRGGSGGRGGQSNAYRAMDQLLFEPPSVAGWPGGSTWLSSSTFFARVNFLDQWLFPRGAPLPVPALSNATTPQQTVDLALSKLVDGKMPAESRDAIVSFAATLKSPAERAAAVAYLVLASPEYQLV